jgi:hypothetical protein
MRFHLRIDSDNDAFAEDGRAEVSRILGGLALHLLMNRGKTEGDVVDGNGNVVGSWGMDDEL